MTAVAVEREVNPLLLSGPLVAGLHAALLWMAVQWVVPLPELPPAPGFAIDLEPAAAAPAPVVAPVAAPVPPPPRPVVRPMPKRALAPPPVPAAGAPEAPFERPQPQPQAAASEPVAAAQPSPPPAPAQVPAAEMSRWQGLLMAHLERHKRYPRDAWMRRQEGIAAIRFVMDSSGRVLSAAIERPSGVESLDRETLALFERAQPMPRPPGGAGDRIDLVVPVHFQLH